MTARYSDGMNDKDPLKPIRRAYEDALENGGLEQYGDNFVVFGERGLIMDGPDLVKLLTEIANLRKKIKAELGQLFIASANPK
ncbi:MAG TPA: hypothetical protein VJB62_01175 [Patescibacteria group bacterium]|nr:hypothetical protein [Patescibacteria group bacterium]